MHLFSLTPWKALNSTTHFNQHMFIKGDRHKRNKNFAYMDYQNSFYIKNNNAVRNTTNTHRRESGVTTSIVVLTSMFSAASGRSTLISRLATLALFCSLCWAFHCHCFSRCMHSSSAISTLLFNALSAFYLAYSTLPSPLFRPPTPLATNDVAARTCVIWPMSVGQQFMLQDGHLGSH